MSEPSSDNAQPKSNNMRSAIIIGLGGTGQEVIAMIKRMIVERFGGLDQLPIVSFLHLDTATEEAKLTPTSVLGHDISLTQRERVTLKMPAMTDGGASYLVSHPMIRDWFPPALKIENNFSLGAGAVRAFGRIAFAENAQRIESAIHDPRTGAGPAPLKAGARLPFADREYPARKGIAQPLSPRLRARERRLPALLHRRSERPA